MAFSREGFLFSVFHFSETLARRWIYRRFLLLDSVSLQVISSLPASFSSAFTAWNSRLSLSSLLKGMLLFHFSSPSSLFSRAAFSPASLLSSLSLRFSSVASHFLFSAHVILTIQQLFPFLSGLISLYCMLKTGCVFSSIFVICRATGIFCFKIFHAIRHGSRRYQDISCSR